MPPSCQDVYALEAPAAAYAIAGAIAVLVMAGEPPTYRAASTSEHKFILKLTISQTEADAVRVEPIPTAADLTSFQKRIAHLREVTSVENWDEDGGAPVQSEDLDRAADFVRTVIVDTGLPAPTIAASGDGSVHMTWALSRSLRLQLETRNGCFWFSVRQKDGYKTGECSKSEALVIAKRFAQTSRLPYDRATSA